MYTCEFQDHFDHPRNVGEVNHPDGSVTFHNPACGDVLKLTLKLAENRIEEIRFLAQGCAAMLVCGSALTQLVHGQTIQNARALRPHQLVAEVGGLPPSAIHASQLAIKALYAALKQAETSLDSTKVA